MDAAGTGLDIPTPIVVGTVVINRYFLHLEGSHQLIFPSASPSQMNRTDGRVSPSSSSGDELEGEMEDRIEAPSRSLSPIGWPFVSGLAPVTIPSHNANAPTAPPTLDPEALMKEFLAHLREASEFRSRRRGARDMLAHCKPRLAYVNGYLNRTTSGADLDPYIGVLSVFRGELYFDQARAYLLACESPFSTSYCDRLNKARANATYAQHDFTRVSSGNSYYRDHANTMRRHVSQLMREIDRKSQTQGPARRPSLRVSGENIDVFIPLEREPINYHASEAPNGVAFLLACICLAFFCTTLFPRGG
ncbi:hypothetical protein TWF694_007721 [Orbilia ellipsospora]|uniref:Uncharacterized protein n=1 Tax=Orbilia ellipsospora TaxID=2528407 RepID=A0AAV9XL55_9PEZI